MPPNPKGRNRTVSRQDPELSAVQLMHGRLLCLVNHPVTAWLCFNPTMSKGAVRGTFLAVALTQALAAVEMTRPGFDRPGTSRG